MADHSWILAVLDDLSKYALKNNIPDLENNIRAAANSARIEITAGSNKSSSDRDPFAPSFNSRPN